jgi:hypothetical protein
MQRWYEAILVPTIQDLQRCAELNLSLAGADWRWNSKHVLLLWGFAIMSGLTICTKDFD